MNLQQLTTFVTVISEGSMTAAADKLCLTQPAVSQQIKNLEDEMGVPLLVRGVRQIKATPQGEILFEQARKILFHVQQAEIAIKSVGAELKGNIRVGTLNSIGLHLMSPIIGRLMRHNPELSIRVDYGNGEDLVRGFKKGIYDILMIPEAQQEYGIEMVGSVEKKFLLKEEMWLVSSGKEGDMESQMGIQFLSTLPMVQLVDEFPGFQQKMQDMLAAHSRETKVIFESSNVGTLKRVIEAGLGWGYLPAHSVRKQVKSGRLMRTHLKELHYEVDLMFYYHSKSAKSVLCETFYQTLSGQGL